MTTVRDISLTLLAAIALIGVVACVLTGKAVPSDLWLVTGTLIGAVAGVAMPSLGKVDPGATASVQ